MEKIEFTVENSLKKPFLADIRWKKSGTKQPLVLFCHGFKGFKDWGAWEQMATIFANNGFVFCKMNFSGNGIGVKDTMEFTNLNAFAENTITQELDDIHSILAHLKDWEQLDAILDFSSIFLIGHSRAGATTIIESTINNNIKKLVTWAGMFDLFAWVEKQDLGKWKEKRFVSFYNSRTKQDMQVNYTFVEDLRKNEKSYRIEDCLEKMEIPLLLLHGEKDLAVPSSAGKQVYENILHSIFIPIGNGDHTFGVKHPHIGELPENFKTVIENTMEFFID